MVKEIVVTVKGEESSYKQKFLEYDNFQIDEHDPIIQACIQEALNNAKIEPEDIRVRILLVVR